jgi:CRP-like cAMP-binding protein
MELHATRPDAPLEDLLIASAKAREVLGGSGWLSLQPEEFRDEVLRRALPVKYGAGDVIYRIGDPLGGIYGVVSGAVIANVAPPKATPLLVHVLTPGGWTGEGPYLSRQPRRLELRAAMDTSAVYLPLEMMDQMTERNPAAARCFTQIVMMNLDVVLRAFHDLQDPDEYRRIARALRRLTGGVAKPIPLSQAALGILANASRKTVNAALQRFTKSGWVKKGYRSIAIIDPVALSRFAESGEA